MGCSTDKCLSTADLLLRSQHVQKHTVLLIRHCGFGIARGLGSQLHCQVLLINTSTLLLLPHVPLHHVTKRFRTEYNVSQHLHCREITSLAQEQAPRLLASRFRTGLPSAGPEVWPVLTQWCDSISQTCPARVLAERTIDARTNSACDCASMAWMCCKTYCYYI
jgi:hypothetical protein